MTVDEQEAPRSVSSGASDAPAAQGAHDMTRGRVRGHVVRMTLFVLTGLTVQNLYALVDIYWVSRLGKEAVAAVALSSNLMFVSFALTQVLSVGCVALVAQAAGRKDHAEVQRVFNQAQSLALCAGLCFLLLGLGFSRPYAEGLAGDATTAALALSFIRGFIPALALQFAIVALGSALRGIGDMKPGLIAQTSSVLFNMLIAPFLIFGWLTGHALGVGGAALATLIATAAAVLGLAIYMARGKTFLRVRFSEWRPHWPTWKKMMSIGLPAGVEFLLLSITMGTIYAVTSSFGPQAQAGFGIGSRLMQAGFMPAVAVSFSVAAVVGQNYGAGATERVREAVRESQKLVLSFMIFFTALCQIAPAAMVGLFASEPEVIAAGVDYLRTISWGYVASGVIFVSAGVFQGLGNTWPSLLASGLRALIFVGPLIVMSKRPGFTLHRIWLASLVTVFLQLGLQQFLLRRELRLKA